MDCEIESCEFPDTTIPIVGVPPSPPVDTLADTGLVVDPWVFVVIYVLLVAGWVARFWERS